MTTASAPDYDSYSFTVPRPGPEKHTLGGTSHDFWNRSSEYLVEDLRRSGLEPEDMEAYADVVNSASRTDNPMVLASYTIPFYDLNGKKIDEMYRRRRKPKPGTERIVSRYTQPIIELAAGYGYYPYLPPAIWNIGGADGLVNICEGEKKTAAVLKHTGIPSIGILGKDMATETVAILAQALEKLGARTVMIWPDADIVRYDVRKSYGRTVALLRRLLPTVEVKMMQPGWDCDKYKGIDDALAAGVEWSQILSGGVSEGVLPIHPEVLAARYGLQALISPKSGAAKIIINEYNYLTLLRAEGLWGDWWLNEDTRKLMLDDRELAESVDAAEICADMQARLSLPDATVDRLWRCVTAVCEKNTVSPWAEWLKALEWDGIPRLDGWMSRLLGCESDDYSREIGTKWMCAIVARTFEPGTAVDWMLILHGPQGCGKSSLPAALLGEWDSLTTFSCSAIDRDLQMMMSRCRIMNFDEMSIFFRRSEETEFLKEMVTRRADTFRAPYGRDERTYKRGCVLYGSTNREDLIKQDTSGYRRWGVLSVTGVVETEFGLQFDWKGIARERVQLWAEAVALVRGGGVDVSQVTGISERARRYEQQNPIEDAMIDALARLLSETEKLGEVPRGTDGRWYVKALTLQNYLEDASRGLGRQTVHLKNFWDKWKCEKGQGNYGRVRRISAELEKELRR